MKTINISKKLKGQFGIMEYILLSVFLIAILVIGMLMLSGFENLKAKGQTTKEIASRQLLSLGIFSHSNLFTKAENQLDDSKLQASIEEDGCDALEKLIGQQACLEVEALLPSVREENECNPATYPECNKWTVCKEVCTTKTGFRIYTMPVNIFRKIQNRIDLGVITLKVPS
ncbi:MAG TPA: hypothetical protein VJA47_01115 [archaeon]|nr:hypothetical protein [archaeon]